AKGAAADLAPLPRAEKDDALLAIAHPSARPAFEDEAVQADLPPTVNPPTRSCPPTPHLQPLRRLRSGGLGAEPPERDGNG
ncbi:hypothetical protein AB0D23_22235, partial [Streptomyces umbrinus]